MIRPLVNVITRTVQTIPFAKMNGAGNSILVVDERGIGPVMSGEVARRIAEQKIGFDQMMVIGDATISGLDAAVRIFNTDGSRAGACGNGTRCVAWMMLEGQTQTTLRLDVEGTDVVCTRLSDQAFTVDMGSPRFGWRDIPLREPLDTGAVPMGEVLTELALEPPVAVSMGNPHAVFFVPDATTIDLVGHGRRLEHHPLFPDRANISFAQVLDRETIRLRVWERGAGVTLACGSAACATLVAASRRGLTGRRATLCLPGGDLHIDWRKDDDHVLMTGPVELERRGAFSLPDLVDA